MSVVEQKEFTISLMVVKLKRSILKQLPLHEVRYPELQDGDVEMICWIRPEALGSDRGRQPYVLCQRLSSGDVFFWRQWTPAYDGSTMIVANQRVPFAVVG